MTRVRASGKVRINGPVLTIPMSPIPSVGNGLIVMVTGYRDTGLTFGSAVADNRGNAYVNVTERRIASNGAYAIGIFFCPVITAVGTPFNITVTGIAADFFVASAIEVGGLLGGALQVGSWQTNAPASPSTAVTTNNTGPVTGEAFIAAGLVKAGGTTSITAQVVSPVWVQEMEELDGTNWVPGEHDTRIATLAGATAAQWTIAPSGGWAAAVAVFQAASVASRMATVI